MPPEPPSREERQLRVAAARVAPPARRSCTTAFAALRCSGGSVASLGSWSARGWRACSRLCCEDVELLGEGGTGVEGVPRLVLAHHGDHLDATQDRIDRSCYSPCVEANRMAKEQKNGARTGGDGPRANRAAADRASGGSTGPRIWVGGFRRRAATARGQIPGHRRRHRPRASCQVRPEGIGGSARA